VGLVARVVEEAGIPTVCISTGRDITGLVKPPRSLFLNHPMGNTFGRPGDTKMQTQILREALDLIVAASEAGVLVDAPYKWHEEFVYFPGEVTEEAIQKQLKK
jgi:D-proline reductase (dithiol) PrdB